MERLSRDVSRTCQHYQSHDYLVDLNDLRLNDRLCDVTVKVNDREVRAHKVILASRLRYFKARLLDEADNDDVIVLEHVGETNLESFITYAYTGEILITESNALSLLEDSHRLNESGIKKACVNFLEKHLTPHDAAQALELANSIDCFELKIIAKRMVPINFADLSQTAEYLSHDLERVKSILSAGNMQSVESQQMYFEGVMKWILHDLGERRDCLVELLGLVDVTLLTAEYLLEYLDENIADIDNDGMEKDIRAIYRCQKKEAKKRQEEALNRDENVQDVILRRNRQADETSGNFESKRRSFWEQHPSTSVATEDGSQKRGARRGARRQGQRRAQHHVGRRHERHDLAGSTSTSERRQPPTPQRRRRHHREHRSAGNSRRNEADSEKVGNNDAVSDENTGENEADDNDVAAENQQTSSNEENESEAVDNDDSEEHQMGLKLMVTNMCDNTAIQFYDFSLRQWSELVVIEREDNSTSKSGAILNGMLFYVQSTMVSQEIMQEHLRVIDYRTEECITLEIRRNNLSGVAACACDRFMYLCGGITEMGQVTRRVQKYDPETNTLESLAPLITERTGAAAVVYQGSPLVLGGRNRLEITNSVEKYDTDSMEWMAFPSMGSPRRQCAVAILDGKLYACGGQQNSSVEVYDPKVKRWKFVAEMNNARYGFLVIALDGKLVAIGGDRVGTVEVYDPEEDRWRMDGRLAEGLKIRNPIGGFIQST